MPVGRSAAAAALLLLLPQVAAMCAPNDVASPIMLVCVSPWATSSVTPSVGTVATVQLVPLSQSMRLSPSSLTANGQNIVSTFRQLSTSTLNYAASYATQASDTLWPWTGVHVEGVMSVTGLGTVVLDTVVVPGAVPYNDFGAAGLGGIHASTTACVADFNSDGFPDVFVGMPGATSQLWFSRGSVFQEDGLASGVGGFDVRSCTAADVDGDGDIDLYAVTQDGFVNSLYINNGDAQFSENAVAAGISDVPDARAPAFADLDGDEDMVRQAGVWRGSL